MSGPTIVGKFGPTARGVLAAAAVTTLIAVLAVTVLRPDPSPGRSAAPAPVPVEEATLRMIPRSGATGAATCTDPVARQEWRVTWKAIAANASTATATPALTPSTRPATRPALTSPPVEPTREGTTASPGPGTPTNPSSKTLSATSAATERAVAPTALPSVADPTVTMPTVTTPTTTATATGAGPTGAGPTGTGPTGTGPTGTGPTAAPTGPASTGVTAPPAAVSELDARLAEQASAIILIPTGFAVRPLDPKAPASTPAPTPTGTSVPTLLATPTASSPPPGPALPGGWQSRDLDRWLLRWTPSPAETRIAVRNEEWVRSGPLDTLAALPMTVRQDPRFVTPDGACSVYLAPFRSGTAGHNNTVAVVGDSLVAQLYDSGDGTPASTGPLLDRLVAAGDRGEISGQGGRRWGVKPDGLTPLEQADSVLIDEMRGLREARSMVVALGTNDAGWVAHAPDQEQYELRLAWAMTHLAAVVDELHDHGHCTVLVTMASRNKSYGAGGDPALFEPAARAMNDYLRQRANADPHDRLKLWDWGPHADPHGHSDPDPWFGSDTIHLKASGLPHYADELAAAAAQC